MRLGSFSASLTHSFRDTMCYLSVSNSGAGAGRSGEGGRPGLCLHAAYIPVGAGRCQHPQSNGLKPLGLCSADAVESQAGSWASGVPGSEAVSWLPGTVPGLPQRPKHLPKSQGKALPFWRRQREEAE